jgi:hypothetical protein
VPEARGASPGIRPENPAEGNGPVHHRVLDDPDPVIQRERDVHRWCPGKHGGAPDDQEGQDAPSSAGRRDGRGRRGAFHRRDPRARERCPPDPGEGRARPR